MSNKLCIFNNNTNNKYMSIENEYFKELNFKDEYNSYFEFYNINKPVIYEAIVCVFEEFKRISNKNKNNDRVIILRLDVTIEGVQWSNNLGFTSEQYFVLKRDILPYFEENENYEICDRILKLHNELVES